MAGEAKAPSYSHFSEFIFVLQGRMSLVNNDIDEEIAQLVHQIEMQREISSRSVCKPESKSESEPGAT